MPLNTFRKLTHSLFALCLTIGVASAQPTEFSVTSLQAGMHVIQAEVADDNPKRMQGLMYRRDLPGNRGMVFVFDRADAHCMWMKNTLIPLSVAFLDDSGRILNIADMQPQSEVNHCARGAARYALEMAQGWFSKRGIREGDRINGVEGMRSKN